MPPPSVGVQLLDYGPGGADLELSDIDLTHQPSRSTQTGALVAVAALVGLALLALALLNSSTPGGSDRQPDVAIPQVIERPIERPEIEQAQETQEPLSEAEIEAIKEASTRREELAAQVEILNELAPVERDLLDGLVIAWIRDNDELQVRRLDSGEPLPVSVLAKHDLPPLPKHIRLIGGRNATWLIDLLEPEKSGKLSNTVQMVRLDSTLDSYGFISETEDGPTDFFVGSLWGPSMNGTAQTPKSWDILPVAGAGIVVSSPTAQSSSIRGSGLEQLPRSVGRAVAATPDHVVGVACDNRLQCMGAVSRWDGSEQELFDANALVRAATIRLSPDGARLLSVVGEEWTLIDLASNTSMTWTQPLAVDDSISWTPDSRAVTWVVAETLVAVDLNAEANSGFSATRVSPIGGFGPRLPESDVAVFDVAEVLESTDLAG